MNKRFKALTPLNDVHCRLHGLQFVGFDEPTRAFIKSIKSRPPVEPKEWHKELKSYERKNSTFYAAGLKMMPQGKGQYFKLVRNVP